MKLPISIPALKAALAVTAALFLLPQAQAQYATGFETPSFVSGPLNGQDTWTSGGTVAVRTASEIGAELTGSGLSMGAPVHGGDQALLVSGYGGGVASRRLIAGLESSSKVMLDVWARPLGQRFDVSATNLGNIFLVMEDSSNAAAGRIAGFRFGYYDNGSGSAQPHLDWATVGSGIWQDSGLLWDAATWYNIAMEVDFGTRTYDFYVNGAKINASPLAFYNGSTATSFGAVRIYRGSNQAGMIVDDLAVIPEPAAWLTLLLGGALLLRRRR